jgi:RNA polymerase sigma-70 factor (ECF subfamily)
MSEASTIALVSGVVSNEAHHVAPRDGDTVPPPSGEEVGSTADVDALMRRYANGDASVFERLHDALAPRLRRLCSRLAKQPSDAEDLFQETMLRLHRARATYAPGAPVLPWASAIARSAYVDERRYRGRRPEELREPSPCVAGDDSTESAAFARALVSIVERALDRMSGKLRRAYVLLREEGLSVAQAAVALETSEVIVKQRVHRAEEQIRATVRAEGWSSLVGKRNRANVTAALGRRTGGCAVMKR